MALEYLSFSKSSIDFINFFIRVSVPISVRLPYLLQSPPPSASQSRHDNEGPEVQRQTNCFARHDLRATNEIFSFFIHATINHLFNLPL